MWVDGCQGAQKFQQIGVDAATNVLEALFIRGALPTRLPILIVDMNAGVGNFADATLSLIKTMNHPISYVGLTEDLIGDGWPTGCAVGMVGPLVVPWGRPPLVVPWGRKVTIH